MKAEASVVAGAEHPVLSTRDEGDGVNIKDPLVEQGDGLAMLNMVFIVSAAVRLTLL
jgi:hypothetical protein